VILGCLKKSGFFLTGNPVPQITWHKDGQLLQEDEAHHMMSGGRFLQITNAQVSHTGRYTCLASNIAGDKSKSFRLNVFGRCELQVTL
jgi:hemicentin